MLKTVLQVPCQNVQWIGSNTILFNMLSISRWIPHLYIQYYECTVPQTVMTLLVFSCPPTVRPHCLFVCLICKGGHSGSHFGPV